jgi:multidrug resistance efflux pump
VQAAQARLDQACAALDLLEAGARDQEVSLLQANVARTEAQLGNAHAALKALDAQLARQELSAPVGGSS